MEDFWKSVADHKESIRFLQAKSFSPYSEYSKNWIKEENGIREITLNALYRYEPVIQPLLRNLDSDVNKEWLFDIYVHYLTELEYRNGMDVQELHRRKYLADLKSGAYGKEIAEVFDACEKDDQYMIATTMQKQLDNRESVYLFCDCLVQVMHGGVVYKNRQNNKELLFYYNETKTEERYDRIEMIKELFLPLSYELRVFWKSHFAVLGYQQTLEIDAIEIL